LLKDISLNESVPQQDIKAMETFIAENFTYFSRQNGLNNDALNLLSQAIHIFYNMSMERSFFSKKEMTNWLADLAE